MKNQKKPSYHHGDLRAALLNAAEEELALNGILAFSLRAVAKRAGVSHGAPAHHFQGKQGLLTALAAQGYDRLIKQQTLRQNSADTTPLSQMIASGLGYLDFAIGNNELFRLMFSSDIPDRNDPEFSKASMAAFTDLTSGVERMVGSHPMTDEAAKIQLMTSWSIVHGLAELLISGRGEIPLGFSQMSQAAKDETLSAILRKAWEASTSYV